MCCHQFLSYQLVCVCQDTQLDTSAQTLALGPLLQGSWMIAESSCCTQVLDMHIKINVLEQAKELKYSKTD